MINIPTFTPIEISKDMDVVSNEDNDRLSDDTGGELSGSEWFGFSAQKSEDNANSATKYNAENSLSPDKNEKPTGQQIGSRIPRNSLSLSFLSFCLCPAAYSKYFQRFSSNLCP